MKRILGYLSFPGLVYLICLMHVQQLHASEDTIVNFWHRKIPCKIQRINDTVIAYIKEGETKTRTIPKICVSKIVLANGYTQKFKTHPANAIKVMPLGPMFDHISISYERFFTNHMSYEIQAGYSDSRLNSASTFNEYDGGYDSFSSSKPNSTHYLGYYIKPGLKIFVRSKNTGLVGQGFYFKFEFAYSQFEYGNVMRLAPDESQPWRPLHSIYSNVKFEAVAAIINVGLQKILARKFVVDLQAGFGPADMSWHYSNPDFEKYHWYYNMDSQRNFHGFLYQSGNVCYSVGFKIGYLF